MQSPLTTGKLSVAPGPSKLYGFLLFLLYALSGYVVWWLDLDYWVTFFVGLAFLVSFTHELRTHGLRLTSDAVTKVECQQGAWLITYRRKNTRHFAAVENLVVLEWLVILRFKDQLGTRTSVPIFVDSLSEQAFRQLRGYLNLKLDRS